MNRLLEERILENMNSRVSKQSMSAEEKYNLSRDIEYLQDLPNDIIDFLRKHTSQENENSEEELELDFDLLEYETLVGLRKLVDYQLREKKQMKIFKDSGLSNLIPTQPCKDSDSASSSEGVKASSPVIKASKNVEALHQKQTDLNGLLGQGEKIDPEQFRREEELERLKKEEKARLLAEVKAAKDARRQAEIQAPAEAAAEAKRKRELEREAARQALQKMEKTVEINENCRFLEDLEVLRSAPSAELLPSSVDETSPGHSEDIMASFNLQE